MTPQQIEPLVVLASAWVQQQRAEHRPLGAPLPEVVRSFLSDYYDTSDLDTVRWRVVPEIANPPFREEIAAQLAAEGLPAIDFGNMAGITFIDTVVLSQSRRPPDSGTPSLLLHEMAHVVQYRLLGFDRSPSTISRSL